MQYEKERGHDREMWEERRRRKWENSERCEVFISSPEKAAGGASLVMAAHLAFMQCRVVPGKGCVNGSGHVKAPSSQRM